MTMPTQNEGQWLNCPFLAPAYPNTTFICGMKTTIIRLGKPLLENLPCSTGSYKYCKEYLVKLKFNNAGYNIDPFVSEMKPVAESLSIEEIEGSGNPVSILFMHLNHGVPMPKPENMPPMLLEAHKQ